MISINDIYPFPKRAQISVFEIYFTIIHINIDGNGCLENFITNKPEALVLDNKPMRPQSVLLAK